MCSAKMTKEPVWGNWRHQKCHTFTGNATRWWLILLYKIVKKKQSSTNNLCPLCDGVWRQILGCSTQPGPPSLVYIVCLLRRVFRKSLRQRTAEVESDSVQRRVRLFRYSSPRGTVFDSDAPLQATGTLASQKIRTKLRITSSLQPCNSQTIIMELLWFSLAETSTQKH